MHTMKATISKNPVYSPNIYQHQHSTARMEQKYVSLKNTPVPLDHIQTGDYVVNMGGTIETNMMIANRLGKTGCLVIVENNRQRIAQLSHALEKTAVSHVEFHESYSSTLLIDDASADLVIVNGDLRDMLGKQEILNELERILKINGRLQLTDVIIEHSVLRDNAKAIHLWTGLVARSLTDVNVQHAILYAGFVDFDITWGIDTGLKPIQKIGKTYASTISLTLHARKPESYQEWCNAVIAVE